MSRILLVDTNFSSAPIYEFLISAGHDVFVVGGNPNDFLAKTVKNYIQLDYSNADELRRVVDANNIDFVVPGCNDMSYYVSSVVAHARGQRGIDSPDVTEKINSKEKFRALARRLALPVPRIIDHHELAEHESVIVKPVDAYSGRGVTVVNAANGSELKIAVETARSFSRSGHFLIEEFVIGQLYSHSAFISNGRVVADFIVEEHCTANPFVVDTSRVAVDFPDAIQAALRENVQILAAELNLVDGLVHAQFIKNGDDYWLIEITRRCPGDLYSRLIELSTGFNYVENYVRPFMEKEVTARTMSTKIDLVIRHTVTQGQPGMFGSINFKTPVQLIMQVPLLVSGDELKASPQGRACLLFMRCNSVAEQDDLYAKTIGRDLYRIQASIGVEGA